jgi:hypothetical protein
MNLIGIKMFTPTAVHRTTLAQDVLNLKHKDKQMFKSNPTSVENIRNNF